MEKMTFDNGSGKTLVGVLCDPGETDMCVVMCHGLGSSKESTTCEMVTKRLGDAGIATFRFDFHGHGESEGEFEDVLASQAMHDTLHAITLMKERGFDEVALFGSSFGGFAAYCAAAKTPHLAALALKCPVADFSSLREDLVDEDLDTWRKRGYASWHGRRLNWSFAEDCENAMAYEALDHIDCPSLIVHGSADKIVPVQQSRQAAEKIRTCTLLTIKGADHRFSKEENFNEMLTAICEFLMNAR